MRALVALYLVAATLCWRAVSSQPSCDLNRIEDYPCEFRHPANTNMPEENEYGIYSTRILSGPSCTIRRRNHQIKEIDLIGGDPRLKFLYSPGFELENAEMYGNQMIVNYSVSCPDNHDAFFNITEIIMEEPNCPIRSEMKCRDYVLVIHGENGEFGVTESCGSSSGENSELLTQGTLRILFRTSSRNRFPGFRATVTCLNRSATTNVDQRRKRNIDYVENFERSRQVDVAYVQALTDSYARSGHLALYQQWYPWLFRADNIVLQFGGSFTYTNNRLTILPSPSSEVVEKEQVLTLQILDTLKEFQVFKRSARDRDWQKIVFNGPGTLTIAGCNAYYTQFIVDPRNILPLSDEQRFVVNDLSTAFFEQPLEGPTERLCDEVLEPPPIDPNNLPDEDEDDDNFSLPQCPQPVPSPPRTCNYSDERLLVALANRNSSNLLVRTVVDVLLSCTERETPSRIPDLIARINSVLDVDCSLVSEGSSFSVSCSSSGEGVRVEGCRAVQTTTGESVSLERYCNFPSFTFPALGTGMRPGQHEFIFELVDSSGRTTTKRMLFSVPLFVNCSSRFSSLPQVNITCSSNQIASRLTITECILDRTTPLSQCVFPMFPVDTSRLSSGRHSVQMTFTDGTVTGLQLFVGFNVF